MVSYNPSSICTLRIVSHEHGPTPPSTRCCIRPVPGQGTGISTYPPMISRRFPSRLSSKRGRENQNQSSLASEFFHSEGTSIQGVVVSAACPDAAHEGPTVNYVLPPSICRVTGPIAATFRKRQPLKFLSLAPPCSLRGVSSSKCDVRKERSRKLAPPLSSVAVSNACL